MMTEDYRESDTPRPASVLNLSGQQLLRLENLDGSSVTTLILDRNNLSKIENLDHVERLRQLSMANNAITRMSGIAQLTNLTVLNLPNNQITAIEGTRNLHSLTWLNLSGNVIRSMDQLERNVNLKHLDLSDNHVSAIANISNLKSLKTLLLHGNRITNLRMASQCLPPSITILSLAENLIDDLTEVSFLTTLAKLEQLSIMNNPCVMAPSEELDFDYRPYVINWCLKLRILDGCLVTEKESLRAEWLYSQGKGRYFKPGQHINLVFYLNQNCPLTSIEDPSDEKLAVILSKQRYHQSQLQRTNPSSNSLSVTLGPSSIRSRSAGLRPQTSPERRPKSSSPGSHLYSSEGPATLYEGDYEEEPVKGWSGAEVSPMSSERTPPREGRDLTPIATRSPRSNRLGARFPGGNTESSPVIHDSIPRHNAVHSQVSSQLEEVKENVRPRPLRIVKDLSPPMRERSPESTRTPVESSQRDLLDLTSLKMTTKPQQKIPAPPLSKGPHFAPPRTSNSSGIMTNMNRAATRIQAVWRGHRVRTHHPRVRNFLAEQEKARVREHVGFLQLQLDSYYQAYAQEREIRALQTEAIKGLMHEVSELKSWREKMESSNSLHVKPQHVLNVEATLANVPSLISVLNAHEGGPERVSVLEKACNALETQVSELTRSLTELKATLRMARTQTAEMTLASVPYPGCPLAPKGLHVLHQGTDWLEVGWRPCQTVMANGNTCPEGVVGYRVFVNGMEKVMVYDSKTSVRLTNLDLCQPLSIAVRCVSDVGESYFSETLDVVVERSEMTDLGEEGWRGLSRQSQLSVDEDASEVADRERVYEEARKVMEMSTSYESVKSQATVTEARLSTHNAGSVDSSHDGSLQDEDESPLRPIVKEGMEEEEKERDESMEEESN